MNTALAGTFNYASIQDPGVYISIIPPSPNINGAPTNIIGLVGVGTWGTPNTVINGSKTNDVAVNIGTPQIRTHDLPTYVWAASLVGGAIGYKMVRVTDGTDTAATATIQTNCITLTAKCTGSLGNQITYAAAQGTQANSFMFTVGFPGGPSQIFNNIGKGVSSITVTPGTGYTSVPSAATTAAPNVPGAVTAVIQPVLSLIATPPTVVGGGTSGFAVNDLLYLPNGIILKAATVSTGAVATVTVVNAGSLTGGAIPVNPVSMVSTSGVGLGTPTFTLVWGLGTPNIINPGNGYVAAPTITLTGGGGAGTYVGVLSVWLNLANAINSGNAFSGPSTYVTATAGVGTTAPATGVSTTLAGGTDGANGVTDSTLVGNDGVTRTGMYVLRSTGFDTVTLCDLSTSALWPTIDAFALSETGMACVATQSGDTPAGAVATRVSVGLDSFFTWILAGDWPTFYDSQNGVARLVNPAAFGIGLLGNLTPQLSPLNKPIPGVVSTQRSSSGMPYSATDIQTVEVGGIDVIVGPPTTIGGQYYSFISGRNASSNNAGNGVEWTRMTMFIARSLQSTATGAIIGQLQSNLPNDPTRNNVTALLNSFFANLANPVFGVGGYGMIQNWQVTCDLTNNPPSLQAQGYLFAYCAVQYLNTIRYFVIQLAGSGQAIVTSQATPPSPAQFIGGGGVSL